MPYELLFTSAQRGLKPGSQGYCTVAQTAGIPPLLAAQLEQLSTYAHHFPPGHPQGALNPIVHACLGLRIQDRTWRVLSRICDAGADYSGRTNYFCRHLALEPNEWSLPTGGPMSLLTLPGWFDAPWDGVVRELPPPRLPAAPAYGPAPCLLWERTVGEPGYAGLVVEAVLKRRQVNLLFSPGQDVAGLLREAFDLLPPEQKMQATFSTYAGANLPPSADCLVRCFVAGSNSATNAQRNAQALTLDLTKRLPPLGDQPGAAEARRGEYLGLPQNAPRGHGGPSLAPALAPPTSAPQLQPSRAYGGAALDAPALAPPAPLAANYDPVPYPQMPAPVAAPPYVVPRSGPPAWMGVLTHGTVGLAGCALGALAMALLFPERLRPRPAPPPAAPAPEIARADDPRPPANRTTEPDDELDRGPPRHRTEPRQFDPPPFGSSSAKPPKSPPSAEETNPKPPPPEQDLPPADPKVDQVKPPKPNDEGSKSALPTTPVLSAVDKPAKSGTMQFERRPAEKRVAFDEGSPLDFNPLIRLGTVKYIENEKYTVEFAAWHDSVKVKPNSEGNSWAILFGDTKIADVLLEEINAQQQQQQVIWRWPVPPSMCPVGMPKDLASWGVLVVKGDNSGTMISFPPPPLQDGEKLAAPKLKKFDVDLNNWEVEVMLKRTDDKAVPFAVESDRSSGYLKLEENAESNACRAMLRWTTGSAVSAKSSVSGKSVRSWRYNWRVTYDYPATFGNDRPAGAVPEATAVEVRAKFAAEFEDLKIKLPEKIGKILNVDKGKWDDQYLKNEIRVRRDRIKDWKGSVDERKHIADEIDTLNEGLKIKDRLKYVEEQKKQFEALETAVGKISISFRPYREVGKGETKTKVYLAPVE